MIHYRVAGRAGGAVLRGAVLHAALRLAHPRGPARHRPRLRSPHPLLSGEYFNNYYLLISLYIIHIIALLHFQKSLTILGSSFYGGAILLATTDYFIQDSLVLDWVWERVKVSCDWLILLVLSCDWSRWMWRTRMWTSWPRYPSAGWPG